MSFKKQADLLAIIWKVPYKRYIFDELIGLKLENMRRNTPDMKPEDMSGGWTVEKIREGYQLALLGFTDREMAKVWGVADQTIACWKVEHPEFRKALEEGKAPADAKVAYSLYQRCIGMYVTEEKVIVVRGIPQVITYKRYIPPETEAIKFFLGARQRETWSQKTEVVNNTNVLITKLDLGEYSESDLRAMSEMQMKYILPKLRPGLQAGLQKE